MRRFARSALVTTALVSAAAVVGPVPVAAATTMPLSQKLRNCDFTENPYQGADDYGRAAAEMRTDGRTVTAHIAMATGKLNSPYDVRLIQVPRGMYCAPGDPGVAATTMFTDAAGSGTVTLTAPIEQGATGAWVMISRPSALSQHPDEFYTTDYLFRF